MTMTRCCVVGLGLALGLGGCTETRDPLTGTQSLEVQLVSPTAYGDVDNRLPDSQRTLVVNLTAKDADGEVDTSFNADVRVYAQFLGTLTPDISQQPLATIPVANGVAMNATITLPPSVLGPTTVWFDNGTGLGPEYEHGPVTGTSPTLWYRDPFVADLQRPRTETSLDALSLTPLTDKQIRVSTSRYGARGSMVVTSTFAQGYTLSDVECATGGAMPTPPCTAQAYDHIMVFTFSAPRDQFGRPLQVGEVIASFAGGLSEFNGLTEVGFPRTFTHATDRDVEPVIDPRLLPAPVPFETSWFGALDTSTTCAMTGTCTGRIHFERNEAGAVAFTNAKVCPLDDGPDGVYTQYKQWTIDPSGTGDACGGRDVINLITAGTDFTTDPRTLVGRNLARVVGIVRPVSIGTFNVWIVYPRGSADITP